MLSVTLLTAARFTHPQSPCMGEWVKTTWHAFMAVLLSHLKKVMQLAGKWIELESPCSVEISWIYKDKYYMLLSSLESKKRLKSKREMINSEGDQCGCALDDGGIHMIKVL